jgi:hypothetical protein
MSEVYQGPPGSQGKDPSAARACLDDFIEAALALAAAWNPVLDQPTYPRYLPSFDKFVSDLEAWQDEVEDRPYVEPTDIKPLNVADPAAVRAWIEEVRAQIEDALAAGEDATRPLRERGLGRSTSRRMVIEARMALQQLFQAADGGLE